LIEKLILIKMKPIAWLLLLIVISCGEREESKDFTQPKPNQTISGEFVLQKTIPNPDYTMTFIHYFDFRNSGEVFFENTQIRETGTNTYKHPGTYKREGKRLIATFPDHDMSPFVFTLEDNGDLIDDRGQRIRRVH